MATTRAFLDLEASKRHMYLEVEYRGRNGIERKVELIDYHVFQSYCAWLHSELESSVTSFQRKPYIIWSCLAFECDLTKSESNFLINGNLLQPFDINRVS